MTNTEILTSSNIFVTVPQIAEHFNGMSEHSVRVQIRSGYLPIEHIMNGKRLLVRRDRFIKWARW